MTLSYAVTKDFKVTIKSGSKVIDEVGAFDSLEGAELWGSLVCEKYNSADYAGVDYPNEKPEDDATA
jgi:hypothetical protein